MSDTTAHRLAVGSAVRYIDSPNVEALVLSSRKAPRRGYSNVRIRITRGDPGQEFLQTGMEFDSVSTSWLRDGEPAPQ